MGTSMLVFMLFHVGVQGSKFSNESAASVSPLWSDPFRSIWGSNCMHLCNGTMPSGSTWKWSGATLFFANVSEFWILDGFLFPKVWQFVTVDWLIAHKVSLWIYLKTTQDAGCGSHASVLRLGFAILKMFHVILGGEPKWIMTHWKPTFVIGREQYKKYLILLRCRICQTEATFGPGSTLHPSMPATGAAFFSLGGGFKYFLFSPLPGEMIQFD